MELRIYRNLYIYCFRNIRSRGAVGYLYYCSWNCTVYSLTDVESVPLSKKGLQYIFIMIYPAHTRAEAEGTWVSSVKTLCSH